jgi:hypothetical protein
MRERDRERKRERENIGTVEWAMAKPPTLEFGTPWKARRRLCH